jgi:hypothetical protein
MKEEKGVQRKASPESKATKKHKELVTEELVTGNPT